MICMLMNDYERLPVKRYRLPTMDNTYQYRIKRERAYTRHNCQRIQYNGQINENK
jgi:hypothetical protein